MKNELSINPKLELDFSSEDRLNKSLKAKKILGNVEINNIITNIKENDFVLSTTIKFLLEKVSTLEHSLKNINIKPEINSTSEKQKLNLKIIQLRDMLDDCKECINLGKQEKDKVNNKIDLLYKKYGGSGRFTFEATHLDLQEMQELKKIFYKLNNFLDATYICQNHKNSSIKIKKLLQTYKSY